MRNDVREAAYLLELIVVRGKGVEGIGVSHTKKGREEIEVEIEKKSPLLERMISTSWMDYRVRTEVTGKMYIL